MRIPRISERKLFSVETGKMLVSRLDQCNQHVVVSDKNYGYIHIQPAATGTLFSESFRVYTEQKIAKSPKVHRGRMTADDAVPLVRRCAQSASTVKRKVKHTSFSLVSGGWYVHTNMALAIPKATLVAAHPPLAAASLPGTDSDSS